MYAAYSDQRCNFSANRAQNRRARRSTAETPISDRRFVHAFSARENIEFATVSRQDYLQQRTREQTHAGRKQEGGQRGAGTVDATAVGQTVCEIGSHKRRSRSVQVLNYIKLLEFLFCGKMTIYLFDCSNLLT